MPLRRSDSCADCGGQLAAGVTAAWYPDERVVRCLVCTNSAAVLRTGALVPQPRAGESARREHARRVQRWQAQNRVWAAAFGRPTPWKTHEPEWVRRWARGAVGEEVVGDTLDRLSPEHLLVLHDRRMRDDQGRLTPANIDHLVVTPGGVWVVDTKTHKGRLKVLRSEDSRGRSERLYIRGREQTDLVVGLANQVGSVRRELKKLGSDVPVKGALCFVGTEMPWRKQSIADFPLLGLRRLARLMRRKGHLTPSQRSAVALLLDSRFPRA